MRTTCCQAPDCGRCWLSLLQRPTNRPADAAQQDAFEIINLLRGGLSTTAALAIWTRKDVPLEEDWAPRYLMM